MSLEILHIATWVVPAVLVLVAAFWRPLKLHWTALSAVLLFAALNAAAAIYVLNNLSDSRWSPEGEPPLSAPSFADTPVVGKFLGPLDSALEGVVGGVNDFLAFRHALSVALDFLAISGWSLLVSFPLVILAVVLSLMGAQRRKADFEKYRTTVDSLRDELEVVKRQILHGYSMGMVLPAEAEASNAGPRLTRGG